jgi:hypothetical protein
MWRNGALEPHIGNVQSSDSLPALTTWDPNAIAEACSFGLVTSQDHLVWTGTNFGFEGNESWLISKVGRRLDHLKDSGDSKLQES